MKRGWILLVALVVVSCRTATPQDGTTPSPSNTLTWVCPNQCPDTVVVYIDSRTASAKKVKVIPDTIYIKKGAQDILWVSDSEDLVIEFPPAKNTARDPGFQPVKDPAHKKVHRVKKSDINVDGTFEYTIKGKASDGSDVDHDPQVIIQP